MEENNKADEAFLNNKNVPTQADIINLFFKGMDLPDIINEDVGESIIGDEDMGEPNEVKTVQGSEWIASKLIWHTEEGMICKVNLVKTKPDDGTYTLKNPFYPYNKESIDINEVVSIPYRQQLEYAIENEDFEEAARLRDWDIALKELLKKIKPKLYKAIKESDIKGLDEILTQIRVYRGTLNG